MAGKVIGVAGFSYLAVRLGFGSLPSDLRWSEMIGASALAGIGFTVSLFIADLALAGPRLAAAKLGILAASALARWPGWAVCGSSPAPSRRLPCLDFWRVQIYLPWTQIWKVPCPVPSERR